MDFYCENFFTMPAEQPEKAVDLIRRSNERGIEMLYEMYSSRLLGLIYSMLGDRQAAEEVLHDTFLKVWDNIKSFDEKKANVFTWMMTIARNTAIDTARLKGFQRQKKTEELDPLVYVKGDPSNVDEGMDVAKLTASLDPKYQEVLDLIYLQGYTHTEVADLTGLPLGTVKTRLRNALIQLREGLKGEKGLFMALVFVLLLIYLLRSWT